MAARPSFRSPCSSTSIADSVYVAAAAVASPALNALVNASRRAVIAFSSAPRAAGAVAVAFTAGVDGVASGRAGEPLVVSWAFTPSPAATDATKGIKKSFFINVLPFARTGSPLAARLATSKRRDSGRSGATGLIQLDAESIGQTDDVEDQAVAGD